MPVDLGVEELDGAIAVDALDARDRARVAASRDVAALGDVDRAVRAEHRAPRRAAHRRERPDLAVGVDEELADIAVAEDEPAVPEHHRALRKAEAAAEKA